MGSREERRFRERFHHVGRSSGCKIQGWDGGGGGWGGVNYLTVSETQTDLLKQEESLPRMPEKNYTAHGSIRRKITQ